MANKLFLMATGPQSGKGIASLGILDFFRREGRKVAFFRPFITTPGAGKRDDLLTRLEAYFKTGVAYEDTYAYTLSEARALFNEGKSSVVYDTVIARCKKFEETHDFILCIGPDGRSPDRVFEAAVSAQAAADLAAPVLLLFKSQGRCQAGLAQSSRTAVREMTNNAVQIFGSMFNWAQLNEEDTKALAANAGNAPEGQGAPNVFVMPENENASKTAEDAIAYVSRHIDGKAFVKALDDFTVTAVTPKMFEYGLMSQAKKHVMRIVLPEGADDRILKGGAAVADKGVAEIIILGDEAAVMKRMGELGLAFKGTVINPVTYPKFDEYVATYYEARKAKGVTPEKAREIMTDASYFGTMMVWKDDADGMVSGAMNTTAHTITPAFQFVKTKPGISIVSSIFIMCMKDRLIAYGDCAVNPNPNPAELASIAVSAARTAKIFGIDPRVAMLSYSTGTSGKGPDVDAVIEATKRAREMAPDLPIEGPLQYDAAVDMSVARTKLPGSKVAGRATVLIFPDLNTGNNTYKAVQRAANAIAVGPVLQGLKKPVNDLSRGCTVPDIINTIAVTALQAQAEKGLI